MKVKITIEEHISQDFEVEVTEEAFKQSNCKTVMEYAMRISERKYKDGSFVLDNSEVVNKIMRAEYEDEVNGISDTEWIEF